MLKTFPQIISCLHKELITKMSHFSIYIPSFFFPLLLIIPLIIIIFNHTHQQNIIFIAVQKFTWPRYTVTFYFILGCLTTQTESMFGNPLYAHSKNTKLTFKAFRGNLIYLHFILYDTLLVHFPWILPVEDILLMQQDKLDQLVHVGLILDLILVWRDPQQGRTEANGQVVWIHHVLIRVLGQTEKEKVLDLWIYSIENAKLQFNLS